MSFLVRSPTRAIRSIPVLTGPEDAPLGYSAFTEEGDIYVMLDVGWTKIYDHNTGPVDTQPSNHGIIVDGETFTFDNDPGTFTASVIDHVMSFTYNAP